MALVHPLHKTSAILTEHIEYVEQAVEWLGNQFQWRLCYRASVHGWSAHDFHTRCDNKGPTVTIVKVGEYVSLEDTQTKTGKVVNTYFYKL